MHAWGNSKEAMFGHFQEPSSPLHEVEGLSPHAGSTGLMHDSLYPPCSLQHHPNAGTIPLQRYLQWSQGQNDCKVSDPVACD